MQPYAIEFRNIFTELQRQTLFQGVAVITLARTVCQTGMMPRNAKRHELADSNAAPTLKSDFCPGGRMVDRLTPAI
ncbi:hypothetical protein NEILACOT_05200 [Neisseria lactamica ATCC 23970]|uniref:Uncharacterized protein n=1 Tax=Neisseria lactamica ATCC 23970 TaxID=546265 RepID=D0WCB9_NEILA|nr:hypothetical protein NEILACOT_05200 [Neisseria lactamica ATCC 23970]